MESVKLKARITAEITILLDADGSPPRVLGIEIEAVEVEREPEEEAASP